ncbi:putative secreted protein [Candidatus Phytoplasma asteris]|uniref:Secreted protein n=1 Tax=Candidatus Phytoplasma asteris TaxID=85620 RepID=A0ABZ3CDP4_9MOLU
MDFFLFLRFFICLKKRNATVRQQQNEQNAFSGSQSFI